MKTLFIALCFFISANVFSQNITNTLGTNGLFTIKDASTNFLTLTQSTGQVNILKTLRLENTSNSTAGVIFKGANSFLHNFGTQNTFLGENSGNFTMTGESNTGVGFRSLFSNITGSSNTASGYQSLYYNTTGNSNTGVGNHSLRFNTTGNSNTGVGNQSLESNTSGYSNTGVGNYSLNFNTTGNYNTGIGNYSLNSNTTGNSNTSIGNASLLNNITGYANTSVGFSSLSSNTTGGYNTSLGFYAGSTITTGSNNTNLGNGAEPLTPTSSNQITLGNNQVNALRCNVQTFYSLSDMRDKKNITDLSLGLDFIMKLKPRQFNWDKREWYEGYKSDGSKMSKVPTAGFISQELDAAQTSDKADWLNLVLKDNPDRWEASYGNLLPVMVKAIQELKEENDKLKKKNDELAEEVESLKVSNYRIAKLEKMMNEMNSVKHSSNEKKSEVNLTNNK
ncbi:MAG: tail fiber domain-containing protein [Ignavibacteria bacterium]|nr:tail fiber domain-containing protein [Ignavibacteria bacterium]